MNMICSRLLPAAAADCQLQLSVCCTVSSIDGVKAGEGERGGECAHNSERKWKSLIQAAFSIAPCLFYFTVASLPVGRFVYFIITVSFFAALATRTFAYQFVSFARFI